MHSQTIVDNDIAGTIAAYVYFQVGDRGYFLCCWRTAPVFCDRKGSTRSMPQERLPSSVATGTDVN